MAARRPRRGRSRRRDRFRRSAISCARSSARRSPASCRGRRRELRAVVGHSLLLEPGRAGGAALEPIIVRSAMPGPSRARCGSVASSIAAGHAIRADRPDRRLHADAMVTPSEHEQHVARTACPRSFRAPRRRIPAARRPPPLRRRAEVKGLPPVCQPARLETVAEAHRRRSASPAAASASRTSITPPGSSARVMASQQRVLIGAPASCAARRRTARRGSCARRVARGRRRRRSSPRPPSAPRAMAAMRGRVSIPIRVSNTGAAARRGSRRRPRFGQQREHQALAAADVDERSARRQHAIGQHGPIQRIAAQLAARELPRRDAGGEVAIGGAPHQLGETDSSSPPRSRERRSRAPDRRPSTAPTDDAADDRSAPKLHGSMFRTVSSVSA